VFVEQHPKTGYDIWWGTLGPGGQARSLINSPSAEGNPALSPDGRWLAYQSDESGRGPEIYVVRFPEGTDRNQVSENGGSEPRWAPHGDEFYYRNGRDVVAVSVHAGTSFVTGSRQTLFRVDDSILAAVGFQNGSYNAMPDGRGFVFVDMSKRTPLGRELVIVQNWFEELKALVPAIK
jgi:Tol biopolymer transport system component